jgi:hypothetical protein
MTMLSTSAIAVSRSIVCVATAAMVLACIAGVTAALPGTSESAHGKTFLVKPDFDLAFASLNAGSQVKNDPIATPIAFDQVFASMTKAQLDTPPNREKLRNAGWRRVLQKS